MSFEWGIGTNRGKETTQSTCVCILLFRSGWSQSRGGGTSWIDFFPKYHKSCLCPKTTANARNKCRHIQLRFFFTVLSLHWPFCKSFIDIEIDCVATCFMHGNSVILSIGTPTSSKISKMQQLSSLRVHHTISCLRGYLRHCRGQRIRHSTTSTKADPCMIIGILRESYIVWERRAPLTPDNVQALLSSTPCRLRILVQPGRRRVTEASATSPVCKFLERKVFPPWQSALATLQKQLG